MPDFIARFLDPDVLRRAAKTAVQAFVAAIVLPAADVFSFAAWKAAVLAAGAAAASALWNAVLNPAVGAAQARFSKKPAPRKRK